MPRSTASHLAAYFGALTAIAGTALLLPDAAATWTGRTSSATLAADATLLLAGLLASRIAGHSFRDAPLAAAGVLILGAAPTVLAGRWWIGVAAAGLLAALAPHAAPPGRAGIRVGAAALLALCALSAGIPTAAAAAGFAAGIGLLSNALAERLRSERGRSLREMEQAAELERHRTAALLERLNRYEGPSAGPRRSYLRIALDRRLGAIGALASTMARELRHTLATSTAGPPHLASAAQRGIERAEQLARLATGGQSRELETTLTVVWPQVRTYLGSSIQPHHHLDAHIPEDLPPVAGSAQEWSLILTAVIENSLRALPNGGIIRVRAGRSDRPGRALVTVEDTSVAPPPGLLGGEKKEETDQPTSLAMAAALVESLEGEIRLTYAGDAGGKVEIEVPFYAPDAQTARPAPLCLAGTILLADDDSQMRKTVTRLLTSFGLAVVEADSGTLALARFHAEPGRFRGAVFDVVMPGTPVGDVAAAVRETRPDLPILLISAYDVASYLDAVLALGGVRFLKKPFDREELFTSLRDLFTAGEPELSRPATGGDDPGPSTTHPA